MASRLLDQVRLQLAFAVACAERASGGEPDRMYDRAREQYSWAGILRDSVEDTRKEGEACNGT